MDGFMNMLANLRGGQTLAEQEDAMKDLVEAVRFTGKKGTLTLLAGNAAGKQA